MNVLLTLAAVWVGWQILACWLWPYRACHRCSGTGKRRSPDGKSWGACRRCGGSARRLRLGRRLFMTKP